jgi:hypothetical protein
MRDVRILTADAAASLAAVVAGPPRPARILATFPTAVYLAPDEGRVIAVEASDGVGLPNALRLRAPSTGLALETVDEDAPAEVGGSRVVIGDREIAVDRWVDLRHRAGDLDPDALRAGLDGLDAELAAHDQPLDDDLAARVAALETAVAGRDDAAMLAAARDLVGFGTGLTPSGDDVLCGLLAAGRAFAPALGDDDLDAALHRLGGALHPDAAGRTTALSAALLWHAARAEPARPADHLLRALAGRTPLAPAARALLAVGHSSGRDLAVGIALGTSAALARGDHHTTGATT